jgi:hypothetical protein
MNHQYHSSLGISLLINEAFTTLVLHRVMNKAVTTPLFTEA